MNLKWFINVVGHAPVACPSLYVAQEVYKVYKSRGYVCFVEARTV